MFEKVNQAKAAARNAGADIIDMGMGNPDLPTPPHVLEKLKETLGKPRTDRYSASRAASTACARRKPPITGGGSASNSIRTPRSWRRSARRKVSPMWRR